MTTTKTVFLIGPGFIGWNVLDLLVAEGYNVKALVRREQAGKDIKASGAEPITGELDDKPLIAKYTVQSDIVFHTATADHLPSVEGVIGGLKERAAKGLQTIYIHTSGASVFDDGASGMQAGKAIYSDIDQAAIDSVPDSAPHRNVDLAILKAKKELGSGAKIAIFVPPLIYGFNPKHVRLSIQIPMLTRYAIKEGYSGQIGNGLAVMSTVHVLDLARAYIAVLHHLERTSADDSDLANPYYIIESNGDQEPSWNDIAMMIGSALKDAGRIKDATPKTIPESKYDQLLGEYTPPIFGCNVRTRTVRLKKLGWKPTEKDWKQSFLQDELPQLLKEA